MNELSADRWTIVGHRVTSGLGWYGWRWQDWVEVRHLQRAADEDRVILMHRHHSGGVELVARLAGPAWRRLRISMVDRRGRWA